MLLSIPYQTLEMARIHLNMFQKDTKGRSIAHLSYKDAAVDINDLCILTPPLIVLDYNHTTSRVRFELKEQKGFEAKLASLQKYLASTFYLHRINFLSDDYSLSEIEDLFQNLLVDGTFSAFIYATTHVYTIDGSIIKMNTIQPGDCIRFPICIQGIVQVETYGKQFRLRIQHHVPAVWLVSKVALTTDASDSKASEGKA